MSPDRSKLVVSLGWSFIFFSVVGVVFQTGESTAYYAGTAFTIAVGLAIVISQRGNPKEGFAAWRRAFLWMEIPDEQSARLASKYGAYGAFLVAGVTSVYALLSQHYASIADALFFAIVGLVIYRRASRIAAVSALVWYIAERVFLGFERGFGAAVNVFVVFLFFALVSGVRGTFAYHTRFKGRNVPQKAAEQGDDHAQGFPGDLYARGDGVPEDAGQAASQWRKEAEQGNASAQSSVAVLYVDGEVVPKDLVIAYMWSNLAAAQGNGLGKLTRDSLEEQMTPEQIADAQKMSREWKPKK